MDLPSHPWSFVAVLLCLLCLTFPPPAARALPSAWVAPPPLLPRQAGGGGRSGSRGLVAHGDAGGAAGNQGRGSKGSGGSSRSADGGIGSLGGSNLNNSNNSNNSNNNNNNSSNNNNNNNKIGSNMSDSGNAEGEKGRGGDFAALERQFSQPAAPRRSGISKGLGKGAPTPSQRLRMQQENLDMRWDMSQKKNQTVCCRQCAGEGVEECRFCAGTGMFKIGSELIVHPESGRPPPCPVCRSTGEERCSRCNGVGRIAAWLFKAERRRWEDRSGPQDRS